MPENIKLQVPRNVGIMFMESIQVIFKKGLEFTEADFKPLTEAQLNAYRSKGGNSRETVYRIALVEPTVIQRSLGKITTELEIVTEGQKAKLLEGVKIIHELTTHLNKFQPTFRQRINYLIQQLPPQMDAQKFFPLFDE